MSREDKYKFDDVAGGGPDGRPATYHHPMKDVLGQLESGPDRLLARLEEVHGEPRYDIPRELLRTRID